MLRRTEDRSVPGSEVPVEGPKIEGSIEGSKVEGAFQPDSHTTEPTPPVSQRSGGPNTAPAYGGSISEARIDAFVSVKTYSRILRRISVTFTGNFLEFREVSESIAVFFIYLFHYGISDVMFLCFFWVFLGELTTKIEKEEFLLTDYPQSLPNRSPGG